MNQVATSSSARLIGTACDWVIGTTDAWNRFWFRPQLPHTLAVLRIVTGLMLLYSHLVLASDLSSFVGDTAWINNETARQLHDGAFGFSDWGRSYLWYLDNPLLLWVHHALTIVVTACFAAGLLTRVTAPAAWFLQLMYVHRLTGHLFGLDQIVTYSTMYLMLAPCGSLFSVDAWLREKLMPTLGSRRWFGWLFPTLAPSVMANIATRLFQIHLCTIYFFGGVAKARGVTWWDGTAMWYSAGNYEYQSLDLTWIADYPRLASALTHATLLWELSYAALVWPRLTRPLVIGLAIAMHAGIAMFLGMITFGLMMIAANMIFVPPALLAGTTQSEDELPDEAVDLDDFELDVPAEESVDLMGSSLSGLSSSSLSGIGSDDLQQREQRIARRENRIREASDKVNARAKKLKAREAVYKERVERLKEREAKIKDVVDRAKERKKK
jgi:uncharacterized membrane protein YphA (DoxX/SURF4 family)